MSFWTFNENDNCARKARKVLQIPAIGSEIAAVLAGIAYANLDSKDLQVNCKIAAFSFFTFGIILFAACVVLEECCLGLDCSGLFSKKAVDERSPILKQEQEQEQGPIASV